jgi:hypothetical protein
MSWVRKHIKVNRPVGKPEREKGKRKRGNHHHEHHHHHIKREEESKLRSISCISEKDR